MKRVWKCSVCSQEAVWGKGWAWYGSIKDEDDGNMGLVVCSDACRKRAPRFTEVYPTKGEQLKRDRASRKQARLSRKIVVTSVPVVFPKRGWCGPLC